MEQIKQDAIGFIRRHCNKELRELILSPCMDEHHPFIINFIHLADVQLHLAQALLQAPMNMLGLFNEALREAQMQELMSLQHHEDNLKETAQIRIHNLPCEIDSSPGLWRPGIRAVGSHHIGKFITINGTIVRASPVKMFQYKKLYECTRCHNQIILTCSLEHGGEVNVPEICPRSDKPCSGSKFKMVDDDDTSKYLTGYQELKVQEKMKCLAMGSMPCCITALMLHEMADSARPGDDIVLTGVVVPRWEGLKPGERCSADLVLIVHHSVITSKKQIEGEVSKDLEAMFQDFWIQQQDCPFHARNSIVAAVCPQLHGLFLLKLATLLTLAGGVQRQQDGSSIRGDLHMLIIGDPGLGKSQVMKFASRVSHRSVMTTGKGSSGAGLTVTAVKDGSNWSLEAGALVLADGGLCCIDEFDGIKEEDRAMLHEAMEQQTIHVAKAGMVTTLPTRTTIFAATNPRRGWTPSRPLTEATSMSGPLLSRFDILLVMSDVRNQHWDKAVADHVLQALAPPGGSESSEQDNVAGSHGGTDGWTVEVLQSYLIWCKRTFFPVMSPEAEAVIGAYYQALRRSDDRNAARTTVRMLESLVRVAQAHARLMARSNVSQDDAIVAVMVVEASQNCLMVIGSDSAIYSSFVDHPDAEHRNMGRLILRALGLPDHMQLMLPAPAQSQQGKRDPPADIYQKQHQKGLEKQDKPFFDSPSWDDDVAVPPLDQCFSYQREGQPLGYSNLAPIASPVCTTVTAVPDTFRYPFNFDNGLQAAAPAHKTDMGGRNVFSGLPPHQIPTHCLSTDRKVTASAQMQFRPSTHVDPSTFIVSSLGKAKGAPGIGRPSGTSSVSERSTSILRRIALSEDDDLELTED